MTNVIQLNAPPARRSHQDRQSEMIDCFASYRRFGYDVFWLKENAELLNILECTGATFAPAAFQPHDGFYAQVEKRLGFFPQYYRFILSICFDLEDLGMPATRANRWLTGWHAKDWPLPSSPISKRAGVQRLLTRRGVSVTLENCNFVERLQNFAEKSETFVMPNKKAPKVHDFGNDAFLVELFYAARAIHRSAVVVSVRVRPAFRRGLRSGALGCRRDAGWM